MVSRTRTWIGEPWMILNNDKKKIVSDMPENASIPNIKLVMQFLSSSLRTALKKHRIENKLQEFRSSSYVTHLMEHFFFYSFALASLKPNHGFWLDVRGWDILYIYLFYFSRMNKDVTILWFILFVNLSAYLIYSTLVCFIGLPVVEIISANFCTMRNSY